MTVTVAPSTTVVPTSRVAGVKLVRRYSSPSTLLRTSTVKSDREMLAPSSTLSAVAVMNTVVPS
jgi:hypothetical protein